MDTNFSACSLSRKKDQALNNNKKKALGYEQTHTVLKQQGISICIGKCLG